MAEPLLLLSGTYVGPELTAEFGRLPPSLLPNGNRRLFEAQVELARRLGADPVLSLPRDFRLDGQDERRLAQLETRVVRVDAALSLAASLRGLVDALAPAGGIFVLFGDTLVANESAPWPSDGFATGQTDHVASWTRYESAAEHPFIDHRSEVEGSDRVVAGLFHFSDAAALRAALDGRESFADVLNAYHERHALHPVSALDWLDFGHLFTYHQSRRAELVSRSFNKVESEGVFITKTGTPPQKIFAEASWFRNLPPELRPYSPHLIDMSRDPEISYRLEYLHLPILSEIFTFANLPSRSLLAMVGSCKAFLELLQSHRPQAYEVPATYGTMFFDDMVVGKTGERLERFAALDGVDLREPWRINGRTMPDLQQLAAALVANVRPTRPDDLCVWHGDFHFANIFYDFRSRSVRVVDPRGMLSNGVMSMYGDARYDICKLGHSVLGLYDLVVSDRYEFERLGPYDLAFSIPLKDSQQRLVDGYSRLQIGPYPCADGEMLCLVALLFLTMLPLHEPSTRRLAMLANAYRLADMAGVLA